MVRCLISHLNKYRLRDKDLEQQLIKIQSCQMAFSQRSIIIKIWINTGKLITIISPLIMQLEIRNLNWANLLGPLVEEQIIQESIRSHKQIKNSLIKLLLIFITIEQIMTVLSSLQNNWNLKSRVRTFEIRIISLQAKLNPTLYLTTKGSINSNNF